MLNCLGRCVETAKCLEAEDMRFEDKFLRGYAKAIGGLVCIFVAAVLIRVLPDYISLPLICLLVGFFIACCTTPQNQERGQSELLISEAEQDQSESELEQSESGPDDIDARGQCPPEGRSLFA